MTRLQVISCVLVRVYVETLVPKKEKVEITLVVKKYVDTILRVLSYI